MHGLLDADDLVLCDESEEDLRTMVGWFVRVKKERTESECKEEQGDGVSWGGGIGL